MDHLLARAGFKMVRYADDFVILCPTPGDAQRALELVREWTEANGLTLNPTKKKIVDARQGGFDFPGYTFRQGPNASFEDCGLFSLVTAHHLACQSLTR